MREAKVTIVNRLGLHARAAAKLVRLAQSFESTVTAEAESQEVDGKSIMRIMLLAASQGSELTLRVDGPDEDEALAALVALIESGFEEEG